MTVSALECALGAMNLEITLLGLVVIGMVVLIALHIMEDKIIVIADKSDGKD